MHEVVNGANGSVTWCGGFACEVCRRHADQTNYWLAYPINSTVVIPLAYPSFRTYATPASAMPVTWS